MKYSNHKIEQLIEERNAMLYKYKYNTEIQKEIEKERSKYRFDWSRFFLFLGLCAWLVFAVEANKKIFPKTSVWSWEHYSTLKSIF